LEKTLWAEADKLGFFINTVTESVVDKEKEVVKNEKRQGVDNQPYGHTDYVIDQAMYPDGHPYQWQVIGSLRDLESAELADIVDFHRAWYGPNNATLVVAGDLDVEQTKAWIERYFGEIPSREMPAAVEPEPVQLVESVRLFHEDNYAQLPVLTLAAPTVPLYHPDGYALDILLELLTDGKSAPFYEVLVEEEALAPAVFAGNPQSELAGSFFFKIDAYEGTDLDDVLAAVERAFDRFESEGVPPDELQRVKAGYETGFYRNLTSVLGKAFQLARYNLFLGDPGYAGEDLEQLLGVTAEDVMRVYEKYVKDRPRIAVSFVPLGSAELALEGSQRAEVVEEPIVQGAEAELDEVVRGNAKTASAIERGVEPPYGESPTLSAPDVWRTELSNGVPVLGVVDDEVPLVQFQLRIKGGQLLDDPRKVGVANLLAETMTEGTASKTSAELEKAIDLLGSTINVTSGTQSFVISGSTLARNYGATMALVEEILLEPGFDADEFDLAKQRVASLLLRRAANPVAVASDVFSNLLYGEHVLAQVRQGSVESVDGITLDDLRAYYADNVAPAHAAFLVAGDVSEEEVVASLSGIAERWRGEELVLPAPPSWDANRAGLYFVDVPDASQSVLRIGYLALAESAAEFYPATVMNFRLGGGGFASDLTQVLREQRGYTYGIGSGFSGSDAPGPFQISSSVRSNVTFEALDAVKDIVEAHGPAFDAEDLEATQSFLLRANARAFETRGAKLGLLADMNAYGFPADYVLQREQIVRDMTIERIQELARTYLDPAGMIWLVVGDARTQLDGLRALGLGEPTILDRDGQPIG
jgi:zinc protease